MMDNLCIGTAQFGMEYGIANRTGQPLEKEIRRMVHKAAQNNAWFFDTASAYGNSEALLGEVFKSLDICQKVKVITKISPDFDFKRPQALGNAVKESTNRMGIECLWGLMLHRTKINGPWEPFLESVRRLKQESIIAHFGVSVYHPEEAVAFSQHPDFDIIQVPFNVLDRRLLDNGFFNIAAENRKLIFIRSVYLQGLLMMSDIERNEKGMGWANPIISGLDDHIKKNRLDKKAFLINAVIQAAPTARLIIGMETIKQLDENLRLMQSRGASGKCIDDWWDRLSLHPEKLLNPSLWEV